MATIFRPNTDFIPAERATHRSKTILWSVPVGRFLFSLIFIMSGINHFSSGSVSYVANAGVPMADILVPISGLIALIGGLSVLIGLHARVGAMLLLLFLIPVTVMMHDFWAITDPEMAQMQMTQFMKNLALIGGAIIISFYGAGPVSFDHYQARKGARALDRKTKFY